MLGIFGREGLYAATLWPLESNNNFIYGGFEMFRNYDGANGSFGDTSIRATNTDVAAASVYASVDAGNAARMVIVCINKNDTAQTAGIAVTHTDAVPHRAGLHAHERELRAAAPDGHRHHAHERIPVHDAGEQRDHARARAVTRFREMGTDPIFSCRSS